MIPKKKKTNNYIDNKRLFEEMKLHVAAYNEAKENNKELPIINNYIGKSIQDIAHNLAKSYRFSSYSWLEDMTGDAIENCLRYLHNFNPEKTQNPFAYFTQIMFYAFIRRIDKEKKQTYTKYKLTERAMIENALIFSSSVEVDADMKEFLDIEKMAAMAERYEKKKPKKAKKQGVENFIEEDVE